MLFEDLALCSVGIFCFLVFVLFVCSEVVVLLGSFGTVSVEFFFRFNAVAKFRFFSEVLCCCWNCNAVAKFRFFSEVLCCCWNCHEVLVLLGSLLLL